MNDKLAVVKIDHYILSIILASFDETLFHCDRPRKDNHAIIHKDSGLHIRL